MLEALLESALKEKILFYLLANDEGYPSEIARNFAFNLNAVQYQLLKLENAGILDSRLRGKIRLYQFSPRYAMKKELLALLQKAFEFVRQEEKEKYYFQRRRPRKTGKPGQ